jgi:exodeoxyribonuclease V gamma subunit
MLNLIFAPSADALVPLAGAKIFGAWRDPFDPPAVIVPNPAVGKWLTVKLAQDPSIGCVANLRMLTLERFLWNALEPGPGTELVSAGHLSQAVCALLDENLLAGDIYKPLKNYLIDRSINAVKRVQLSAIIARQFLEYEYNRPSVWNEEASRWGRHGIDAAWLLGKKYFGGREHEAWQIDLYRRAHGYLSKSASPRYATLPHLYRLRREESAREGGTWCNINSNPQIILFGVSKISHFHRNTLVEISQSAGVDMHVLLTNPCAEFWEDVDTGRRTRAPRRRWSSDSPEEAAGIKPVKPDDYEEPELKLFNYEEDHALLKLWGAAGKENIFLWCPQAQWNFEYHGVTVDTDVTAPTLLQAVQHSLLSRNNSLNFAGAAADASLQILACPDPSREVEEAREIILDMAHENLISDFSDVAVYMPDPGKYAPYIQRVFGAYPRSHPEYIPFTILGASGGSSLAARGLSALLDIAAGGFNRALVFELIENPIVRAGRRFSTRDLEMWEGWAEEYGMFRGYNAGQRELMGDKGSAVTDAHTFERGMRLVLERSAGTADEGGARSAELFLSLLGELNELSVFFTNTGTRANEVRPRDGDGLLDVREAVEVVRRAVWAWFGRIGGDSIDEAAGARARRDALNGLELIELQHKCAGRAGIPRDEFFALARGCAAGELSTPSAARRGVTFAPLRASMVLPHRAIFAMGLCAAEFPGTNEAPGWDLLSSGRIVGDSDRVRDNRFAFLEMLHAAKERLTLSYRARDMQKDETLQPSSVILELEEYLMGQGLIDTAGNSRKCSARRDIPWVAHEALDAARKAGRKHGTWDREQKELAAASLKERVGHRSDLYVNGSLSTGERVNPPVKTVDIRALAHFLSNPLEYHLCRTLGIWNDEAPGDMAATDEPLDSGKLNISALRKETWTEILYAIFTGGPASCRNSAKDIANEVYDDYVDSGQAPEGHICRMEREELVKWAEAYADNAPELLDDNRFPNHRLVEKYEFTLPCGEFMVNVCHQLAIVPKDAGSQGHKTGVLDFDKTGKPADNLKLWLYGLATLLYEAKSGGARRPVALVTLNHGEKPKGGKSMIQVSYMNMDERGQSVAEEWLAGIIAQMLMEKHREYLPFDAIADILKPDKKGDEGYEKRLQRLTAGALRDSIARGSYVTYKEAFKLTDAKPAEMDDDKLRLLADSRYALFFGRRFHE